MSIIRTVLISGALAGTILVASNPRPAAAEVVQVVVGVTPSCPYGISACWSGAYAVLGGLQGVTAVAKTPDAYNCTAQLQIPPEKLPDVKLWTDQFHRRAGNIYDFRGVEVTVKGSLTSNADGLALTWPGIDRPIRLVPLKNKLQFNYRKRTPRQAEEDEARAFAKLSELADKTASIPFDIEITGPLLNDDKGPSIEVREFYPLAAP